MLTRQKETAKTKANRIRNRKMKRIKNQDTDPNVYILVPHRNRADQLEIFEIVMKNNLVMYPHMAMIFIEQNSLGDGDEQLPFNKGALLNIGFLYLKQKFPQTYSTFTIVMHDLDVILSNSLDLGQLFSTATGTIRHVFGFDFCLGGIVVINAIDFENMNGYPMIWGWGCEDNGLQDRAKLHHIAIDRNKKSFLNANELKLTGVTFLDHTAPLHVQPRAFLVSEWKRFDDGDTAQEGLSTLKVAPKDICVEKPKGHCKHIGIFVRNIDFGHFPNLSESNKAFKTYLRVDDEFKDGKTTSFRKATPEFCAYFH
jgi:hypothetical protein